MGIDVTAYRQLKEESRPDGDPEESNLFLALENTDFPGRIEGVKDGAFYSYAEEFHFAAGSYGGYNNWREDLAKFAGWPAKAGEEQKPHSNSAWAADGGPFWELINFADNEGVIGPVVAAKLAKEFAEHRERADAIGGWFAKKYADWQKAFEMAADGGCVDFH